ncbi:MAG: Spore protein SP21 [Calditrichaeota bacterium]|nr:Spore protein SP21 [Calditrichota bacterium]
MKRKPSRMKTGAAMYSDADLDVYFEYFVGTYRPGMAGREWHPAADLYETNDCLIVEIDIAGIDTADLEITLDKDSLIIEGVRRESIQRDRKRVHALEVPYGPFRRVFQLPVPVCAERARAEYAKGMLTIRLRKRDRPLQKRMRVRIS